MAAGEFPSLHEAQAAIAREHGLPSWAVLKRHISETQDTHALDQLRWVISRFAGAADPRLDGSGRRRAEGSTSTRSYVDGYIPTCPTFATTSFTMTATILPT